MPECHSQDGDGTEERQKCLDARIVAKALTINAHIKYSHSAHFLQSLLRSLRSYRCSCSYWCSSPNWKFNSQTHAPQSRKAHLFWHPPLRPSRSLAPLHCLSLASLV